MKYLLLSVTLLSACSPVLLQYPSICGEDKDCQRNSDAQTLSYIGQHVAATKLLCLDLDLKPILGDDCSL